MTNITLSVPKDLHDDMKHFSEIRWSEVARRAIAEKIETLKLAENLAKKSKLSKKDIDDFDLLIKKNAAKRFVK